MSKYWDPAWEKPTIVLSGRVDLEDIVERTRDIEIPDGYDTKLCARNGLSRVAVFGPDYTLLVSAPDREHAAEAQRQVGRLTYYFICTRPWIRLTDGCRVDGDTLTVAFDVFLDDGSIEHVQESGRKPLNVQEVRVVEDGGRLEYTLDNGVGSHDAVLLAQMVAIKQPFAPSYLDLEIRYIGRARGVVAQRCALDRLEQHDKYQRVLEEIMRSAHRNRDAWLVLASGTTINIMQAADDEAQLPPEEAERAANRARSILSTNRRVDITEALLINHFKPPLNDQHVRSLDLSGRTFKYCYDADLTGIAVAYSTAIFGIALYTDAVPPRLDHGMTVCL